MRAADRPQRALRSSDRSRLIKSRDHQMRRRTLLQILASSVPVLPVTRVRLAAQVRAFTPEAIAVRAKSRPPCCPPSIGSATRSRNRRPLRRVGAGLRGGRGPRTRVRRPDAREVRACRRCRITWRSSRPSARRRAGAEAPLPRCRSTPGVPLLSDALAAAKVTELPGRPTGRHIVSDLMAFYFRSSEANDLAYRSPHRPPDVPDAGADDAPPGADA